MPPLLTLAAPYIAIISPPLAEHDLREFLACMSAAKATRRYECCEVPRGNDENDLVWTMPRQLGPLTPFRHSRYCEISLAVEITDPKPKQIAGCIALGRRLETVDGLRTHFLSVRFTVTGQAPKKDPFGSSEAGIGLRGCSRAHEHQSSFEFWTGYNGTLFYEDKRRRADLFTAILERAVLNDRVSVRLEDGLLFFDAVPGQEIELSGADLVRRANANLCRVRRPTYEDALQRFERVLADRDIVRRPESLSFSLRITPEGYAALANDLNAFASGWELDFLGGYRPDCDPFTADSATGFDGRFPIFRWMLTADSSTFFEASIVPTPEGRRVVIHSNCNDMKLLRKEAAASGLSFEPYDFEAAGAREPQPATKGN
jgi:hypothetical protein